MASSYGWAAAIFGLLALIGFLYWMLRRRLTVERALALESAGREASEAARAKEKEIRDAAERIRREPGPRVPSLDELRPTAGDAPEKSP